MCPTASFLATGEFNKKFKMHAWSTSMLLLLHSTFMLSLVIVMEITLLIMENHGIVFLNFCENPVSLTV